jgi:cyclophilin family peptidyl-prolyl cis-trans isomerase
MKRYLSKLISRIARRFRTARSDRHPGRLRSRVRPYLESLEDRYLLTTPTLGAIGDITVPAGHVFQVPLDGFDGDGDALDFTATGTAPELGLSVPAGNNSLRIQTAINGAPQTDIVLQLFNDLAPRTSQAISDLVAEDFYDGRVFHRIIPDFVAQLGDRRFQFTATAADNLFTATGHALTNGMTVRVETRTGVTLPGGVAAGTDFFVRDVTGNTFRLSAIQGGTAVDLTSDGGGDVVEAFPEDLTPIDDEYDRRLTFSGFGQLAMAKTPPDDAGTAQVFITDVDLSVGDPGKLPPRHLNFDHTIFGQLVEGVTPLTNIINAGSAGAGTPTANVVITDMDVFVDNQNGVLRVAAPVGLQFTAVAATDLFTAPGHTLTDGRTVRIETRTGATLPGGITAGTNLFVRDVNGSTFRLATTLGGAAIDITSDGGGDTLPGPSTITVTADDGNGGMTTRTFNVSVIADTVNDKPFLDTIPSLTTTMGQPVTIDLSTDLENDALTHAVGGTNNFLTGGNLVNQPANATVALNAATGQVTVTPNGGFQGTLEVRVGVRDANHGTDVAAFDTQVVQILVGADSDSATVNAGTAVPTASAGADQPGEAGVKATATNNTATSPAITLNVATYSVNPTDEAMDDTGGFVDIRADGTDSTDAIDANFYYGSNIGPDLEGTMGLYFFDTADGRWRPVRGSGDTDPMFDGADNLDGTVSGGRFHVLFDGTSTPLATELTGTVFAMPSQAAAGRPTFTAGVLSIVGTVRDDTIDVEVNENGEVQVVMNGVMSGTFLLDDVKRLMIDGGAGQDEITINEDLAVPSKVIGGSGNDMLVGGGGDDVIRGGRGGDTVAGGGGDDKLRGNRGDDEITGGDGDDRIAGGRDDDDIDGEAGDDRAKGHHGDDTMAGGEGDDMLAGGDGDDEIDGNDGDDKLRGGAGNDDLAGSEGDDTLIGGPREDDFGNIRDGDDTLDGGEGNDKLFGSDGDDDLDGGEGEDTLRGGAGNDNVDDPTGRTDSFDDAGVRGIATFLLPGAPDIFVEFLHVEGPVDYSAFTNPPTYGPHLARPAAGADPGAPVQPTGVHTVELGDADLVHNLEHGLVWISYNPNMLSQEDLDELTKFVRSFGPNGDGSGDGIILAPRVANDSAIALASWGRLQRLDGFDRRAVKTFIETNRGRGPEGFITP